MLILSHCHSRRISLIRRLLKTAHHESLHFSNAVKATVHLCCPVGFLTRQRTHILVSNTNLWKQVSCCASEPNNLSLKFCSLSHSADTTVLSVRVPTSLPTQLGSALELSWKGILSERTFMGFFFYYHVFWTNTLKCVSLPAQTTVLLLSQQLIFNLYIFHSIFYNLAWEHNVPYTSHPLPTQQGFLCAKCYLEFYHRDRNSALCWFCSNKYAVISSSKMQSPNLHYAVFQFTHLKWLTISK